MTPQSVQRAIRRHVSQGSGVPRELVIPGNSPGRRPREPYASVLIISDVVESETLSRYRQDPGDAEATIIDNVTNHRAVASVQFYRSQTYERLGAHDAARLFANWIGTDEGKQAEDRAGFRLEGPFIVRNLDNVIDDHFEERAGIDLNVLYRYRDPASQDVGTMENVTIEVCGPGDDQHETITETSP